MGKKSWSGFTLTELLVALAVLGVISAFVIPKILSGQQNSRRNAVFKETLSALSAIVYEASATEQLAGGDTYTLLSGKLNYILTCPTDSSSEGCWPSADPLAVNNKGFLLHSGVMISGIGNTASETNETILLDWNGATGPNTRGQDQLAVSLCTDPDGCATGAGFTAIQAQKPSQFTLSGANAVAGESALYDALW